jgi:hypothetical protein
MHGSYPHVSNTGEEMYKAEPVTAKALGRTIGKEQRETIPQLERKALLQRHYRCRWVARRSTMSPGCNSSEFVYADSA